MLTMIIALFSLVVLLWNSSRWSWRRWWLWWWMMVDGGWCHVIQKETWKRHERDMERLGKTWKDMRDTWKTWGRHGRHERDMERHGRHERDMERHRETWKDIGGSAASLWQQRSFWANTYAYRVYTLRRGFDEMPKITARETIFRVFLMTSWWYPFAWRV